MFEPTVMGVLLLQSKEKQQPSAGAEQEKSEESDAVSEANSTASKPHVEFNKEPEVIVPEKDLPPAPANKVCLPFFGSNNKLRLW